MDQEVIHSCFAPGSFIMKTFFPQIQQTIQELIIDKETQKGFVVNRDGICRKYMCKVIHLVQNKSGS